MTQSAPEIDRTLRFLRVVLSGIHRSFIAGKIPSDKSWRALCKKNLTFFSPAVYNVPTTRRRASVFMPAVFSFLLFSFRRSRFVE
jgi:hypothetical protein